MPESNTPQDGTKDKSHDSGLRVVPSSGTGDSGEEVIPPLRPSRVSEPIELDDVSVPTVQKAGKNDEVPPKEKTLDEVLPPVRPSRVSEPINLVELPENKPFTEASKSVDLSEDAPLSVDDIRELTHIVRKNPEDFPSFSPNGDPHLARGVNVRKPNHKKTDQLTRGAVKQVEGAITNIEAHVPFNQDPYIKLNPDSDKEGLPAPSIATQNVIDAKSAKPADFHVFVPHIGKGEELDLNEPKVPSFAEVALAAKDTFKLDPKRFYTTDGSSAPKIEGADGNESEEAKQEAERKNKRRWQRSAGGAAAIGALIGGTLGSFGTGSSPEKKPVPATAKTDFTVSFVGNDENGRGMRSQDAGSMDFTRIDVAEKKADTETSHEVTITKAEPTKSETAPAVKTSPAVTEESTKEKPAEKTAEKKEEKAASKRPFKNGPNRKNRGGEGGGRGVNTIGDGDTETIRGKKLNVNRNFQATLTWEAEAGGPPVDLDIKVQEKESGKIIYWKNPEGGELVRHTGGDSTGGGPVLGNGTTSGGPENIETKPGIDIPPGTQLLVTVYNDPDKHRSGDATFHLRIRNQGMEEVFNGKIGPGGEETFKTTISEPEQQKGGSDAKTEDKSAFFRKSINNWQANVAASRQSEAPMPGMPAPAPSRG